MRVLIVALAWFATSAPFLCAEETKLASAVQHLLDVGFQSGRVSTSQLQTAYDKSVTLLGETDPNLEYAFSIVLRKNFNAKEAQSRLESAALSDDPVVLLAREKIILRKLKKNRYAHMVENLVDLAESIGKIPVEGTKSADAQRSARWIGMVLAFLEGPLGNNEVMVQALAADAAVKQNLGQDYVDSYQAGRLDLSLRKTELLGSVIEVKDEVQVKKDRLAEQTKKQSEIVEEQQEEFKEKFEEFQDVANDDLSDLDSKLKVLEGQFESSMQTEQVMILTATRLRLELQNLKSEYNRVQNGDRITAGQINNTTTIQRRDRIEQQITFRERELIVMSRDLTLLVQSRRNLVSLAKRMIAKRNNIAARYQSAANAANAEKQRLSRMQQRIAKLEKKAGASPDSDPKVISQLRAIQKFSSYEKRGLTEEKELLIKSTSDQEMIR